MPQGTQVPDVYTMALKVEFMEANNITQKLLGLKLKMKVPASGKNCGCLCFAVCAPLLGGLQGN